MMLTRTCEAMDRLRQVQAQIAADEGLQRASDAVPAVGGRGRATPDSAGVLPRARTGDDRMARHRRRDWRLADQLRLLAIVRTMSASMSTAFP